MAVQRRSRNVPGRLVLLAAAALAALVIQFALPCFVGAAGRLRRAEHSRGGDVLARRAAVSDLSSKAMEELMKDPEKLKQMQEEAQKIMADPEKAKLVQNWSEQMQAAVKKLESDPEMAEFFADIKANGMDAMKKYENDERILAKFSKATGGPESLPGLVGGAAPGGSPPQAKKTFKPGDQVYIRGLSKAPELNGKKAMVVPPTQEEQQTLEGTDRLIVRLLDSGDQFAVKPENLKTSVEEVDNLMGQKLEDVSLYNDALQTEAAKLRESGKLEDIQNDPELKPIFEDIKKNGMAALEKYWEDEELMAKINKVMGAGR